mmetsp:Transcript_13354/g.21816  ORF Transcript_13354/g.21816 Transcript_13354/m.21816 type:complete len:260 (-) Transcript_13354:213-992(-)
MASSPPSRFLLPRVRQDPAKTSLQAAVFALSLVTILACVLISQQYSAVEIPLGSIAPPANSENQFFPELFAPRSKVRGGFIDTPDGIARMFDKVFNVIDPAALKQALEKKPCDTSKCDTPKGRTTSSMRKCTPPRLVLPPPPPAIRPPPAMMMSGRCASDVIDAGSAIVIACDVPGVKKEDIKISLKDSILTVSGKRARNATDNNWTIKDERWFGNFSRAFRVPDTIDTAAINATQVDGVLTIRMGKKPEKKPVSIPIS